MSRVRHIISLLALTLLSLWGAVAHSADAQTLVRDQFNLTDAAGNPVEAGEGSLGHVLTHAVVGCGAAELQGGDCGAGAVAGGISAIIAGEVKDSGATLEEAQEWADEVTLISGIGAALTRADGEAVQIAAGVGTSAFQNNYLWHYQSDMLETARSNLDACSESGDCTSQEIQFLNDRIAYFEGLDEFTDDQLRTACSADPTGALCRVYVGDALCAAESRSTVACGGTPFGIGQRWGYHSPEVAHNILLAEAGRDYSPQFAIDLANNENLQGVLDLLSDYPETVEMVRQYDSVGAALDVGLGIAGSMSVRGIKTGESGLRAGTFGQAQYEISLATNTTLPSSYTRNADGTISGPGNLSGQQAVFRETGEVTADGGAILQRESGGYYTIDANGNQQYIPVADPPTNLQTRGETPWQQSQTYIQDQVGGGEVSYLNGVEVPHGTPGSVRPDAVPDCTQCFEVKNYDLSSTSGQNSLVNTTVEQINTRATHLPDGMQQNIEIDITGQSISDVAQAQITNRIVQGSNGAVTADDINFFTRD